MNPKVNPKVSIIMPAYNCEAYVAEAINSIIAQTYEDWELLVADDGSIDATRTIIDSYHDPRIVKYHNATNMGLVGTWNKLLDLCRGEYIAWQDADDISLPQRLEKQIATFQKDPDLMLCGCNSFRPLKLSGEMVTTNHPLSDEQIKLCIRSEKRFPFTGATRVIRRQILNDIGTFRPFFSRSGGEDVDFILRISERFKVANIQEILYMYRYTRGSVSRKTITDSTFLRIYQDRLAFFLADQRAHNHGIDGLMERGDTKELDRYIEEIRQQYIRDRSIVYRRAFHTKLRNEDYLSAFGDAIEAIKTSPYIRANYSLIVRLIGSIIKTMLRIITRTFRSKLKHNAVEYSKLIE